jgi:CRISPR-associated protein Cas1
MGLLFAKAFAQQALVDAWQEVRDRAMADGQPDAEVQEFERDALRRLGELAARLATGEWEPEPARRVEIPKASGGVRRLAVPTVADRVVERALLEVLDAVIDPTLLPWSFAYRRGLGVNDAVAALTEARDTGATWVARADIDDCFDRIPQWEVMRRLRAVVDDERVVHLVGSILDRQVRGERVADRGRGLHQGGVLSPLLSNLYLDTFDRRMLAAGFRVIRYGDDFAVPVESRLGGERALRAASTELSDLRLELNAGKCHVASFDEGVRFLGETLTASTLAAAETLSHPTETSVYIDRQGSMVRVRGDRLVVTDGDESLLRLNLRRVRQVVCYGRINFTTAFLHRAAERGIEVVLLSENGTLGGRLTSPMSSDPSARRAQFRVADDEGRSRELAASFVIGKVNNMRVTLLRVASRAGDLDAAIAAEQLEKADGQAKVAHDLSQLLGVEGAASRAYLQGVRRLVDGEWGFAGRQPRPPPQPIKSMLSYG